jgi:hypothetical protein
MAAGFRNGRFRLARTPNSVQTFAPDNLQSDSQILAQGFGQHSIGKQFHSSPQITMEDGSPEEFMAT